MRKNYFASAVMFLANNFVSKAGFPKGKVDFVKFLFSKYFYLNPFLVNVSILYVPKKSEHKRFSCVFQGCIKWKHRPEMD